MPRYWGIWSGGMEVDGEWRGGWLRNSDGLYFFYPSPFIAQAHVKDLNKGIRSVPPVVPRYLVREFTGD